MNLTASKWVTPIVVVTGGRDVTPTPEELAAFRWWCESNGARVVRHGAAAGVDSAVGRLAGRWRVERWPADWGEHGRAAGMIRNRAMVQGRRGDHVEFADVLIAWPGGRGTAGCRAEAMKCGVRVIEIAAVVAESEAAK